MSLSYTKSLLPKLKHKKKAFLVFIKLRNICPSLHFKNLLSSLNY